MRALWVYALCIGLTVSCLASAEQGKPMKLPKDSFKISQGTELTDTALDGGMLLPGWYCFQAKAAGDKSAFNSARIMIFAGNLLVCESQMKRVSSEESSFRLLFRIADKSRVKIRFINYFNDAKSQWKDFRLERIDSTAIKTPSYLSMFELWVSCKSTVPVNPGFADYHPDCRENRLASLPPSPSLAGTLHFEPSTLHSIGYELPLRGDWNRNSALQVSYRKKTSSEWKNAQPGLRQMYEHAGQTSGWSWICPNMYSGSIMNLEPGCEYELKFELNDPDGGSMNRVVSAKTRAMPVMDNKDGKVLHVYPPADGKSASLESVFATAEAGDTIMIHSGEYRLDRNIADPARYKEIKYIYPPAAPAMCRLYRNYSESRKHAQLRLSRKCPADRPIIITGEEAATTIIDGESAAILFDLSGVSGLIIRNLTLRNAEMLIYSNSGSNITISDCIMEDCRYAVNASASGSDDIYHQEKSSTARVTNVIVCNNVITGNWPAGQWRNGWTFETGKRGYQNLRQNTGIQLGGQGHDVFNNRISRFWDGINVYPIVRPQGLADMHNSSIDIYGNIIDSCCDDAIETDYGVHNIRVYRNLIANAHMGISCQPVFGGPAYIFRNVIFNIRMFAFKLSRSPVGLMIFNNSCRVANAGRLAPEWSNSRIINNLFIGSAEVPTGPLWTGSPTPETSILNYNGYTKGNCEKIFWVFAQPDSPYSAAGARMFDNCEAFVKATGSEINGIFNLPLSDWRNPLNTIAAYAGFAELDLRLNPGAGAIDAGAVLPNINDEYKGKAPDLGALESGYELPHYGPVKTKKR